MAGPSETTDKMFPPPEEPDPRAPIPLGPSLRVEFLVHRKHLDSEMTKIRKEIAAALARMAPDVTPTSAARRVAQGALWMTKGGAFILAALGLLQAALQAKHPELAGPLGDLRKLFD